MVDWNCRPVFLGCRHNANHHEMHIMKTLAALLTLAGVSCAAYPIAVKLEGEHGTYSYSAKSGLAIAIRNASIHATK